ncbi:unnamed protein product [Nezara viridula]|uniref:DUF4758 domain-containing protein n=1 Tax=Nezara viridula TaxID=85310 RepID=A0A9P0E711_NEZVI|nr:unnamed protein product [Nezara viridula]
MKIFIAITALLLGIAEAAGPVYSTVVSIKPSSVKENEILTTQTVYGFLDFTTTIANTVMIFSPQSQKEAEIKPTSVKKIEQTKSIQVSSVVQIKTQLPGSPKIESSEKQAANNKKISPTKTRIEVSKKVQEEKQVKNTPKIINTNVQTKISKAKELSVDSVKRNVQPTVLLSKSSHKKESVKDENENKVELLESDLLSKQPSENVGETYKIVEGGPATKVRNEPTGLVTKLGGTVVKDGVTTVHETSVIGTYISGKYAQVLKATSHVIQKPSPSKSHHKKTQVEPSQLEDSLPLEALFSTPVGQNLVRHTRRPAVQPPFKNRIQRTKVQETTEHKKKQTRPFKLSHNRFSRPTTTSEVPTVSVFTESATPVRRFHRQRSAGVSSSVISNNIDSGSRRFKPKPTSVSSEATTSLYKFKLARPQGRWQYKTTPKPRVAIRRQDEDVIQSTPATPELEHSEQQPEPSDSPTTSTATPSLSVQTIKVEISTPANFSNAYYEIATIKSPYTFQVGTVKNTRYITLTSTFEKLLEVSSPPTATEPLTENILTSTPVFEKEAPIVTLPMIAIAGSETIPLETMTDIFSTSEILLKTHLLPVVKDSNTTTITLVQTYEVTKVVSATKTLPPTELFQFIPSKTLNEFNTRLDEAGSELHLELDFGDNDNSEEQHSVTMLPEVSNVTEITSLPIPLPTPQEQLTPEKLQQLAFLRFLNPNQPPVVTSTPFISIQTLYDTHVIPVFNGLSTVLSTISRPIKTITNTQYMTNTIPIPSLPLPLFPTPQPQPLITSSPIITQTVITETDSKVLKLTFGAKTAYTTLYSTRVIPTLLTTYHTTQLPIQPTVAPFPSFFPPFNPFSFVG